MFRNNGWQVDQAILSEEDRVVVIRFGHDWDPSCMRMDEVGVAYPLIYLTPISDALQNRPKSEELRSALRSRHLRGARLQQDVRALRPGHGDVLFPVGYPLNSRSL